MAMIIPDTYPLTIIKGRDFEITFEFEGLNTTSYTVTSEIRELESQSSTLIETFTVVNTPGANSTITLSLSESETEAITQDAGFYDILMTDVSNNDYTYIRGPIQFIGSVTEKPAAP